MNRNRGTNGPGQRPEGEPPARLRRAERVLADRTGDLVLLLEEPYDPGNLSATLRTAEALGVQTIHVVRAEPWRIRRKVTQRAERWLTLHRWRRLDEALGFLREEGFRILVAGLGPGAFPLGQVDPGGRLALAFGNESAGASPDLLARSDGEFWIPTLGFTGSLNLSVSVAIALWEVRRRQIEARGRPGDLPEPLRTALRRDWYRHLAGGRAFLETTYRSWMGHVDPTPPGGPAPDRRNRSGGPEQE
jgi:tRNA (guanosine-2'-O-)-methyltransferase